MARNGRQSRSWVTPGQEAARKQKGTETCQQQVSKLGGKLGKEAQASDTSTIPTDTLISA